MNIRSVVTGSIAGVVLGLGATAAVAGVEATNEVPRWMTKVCIREDGVNCQWNARTSGDGRGDSFYVRKFPTGQTCVMYIDRPKKDYCSRTR